MSIADCSINQRMFLVPTPGDTRSENQYTCKTSRLLETLCIKIEEGIKIRSIYSNCTFHIPQEVGAKRKLLSTALPP